MTRPTLYIGNKNYSSWSLRPWLALRWAGVTFDEVVIPLGGPGYGKSQIPAVLEVSPSGRVPALRLGDVVVWDSLAISEYAAEQFPGLLPREAPSRAVCRSLVAEMHSGFAAVRRDLSMNIRRRVRPFDTAEMLDDVRADLARLFEIFESFRVRNAERGPFIMGARTLADAFFMPVATRLRTYGIESPPAARAYVETLLSDADFLAWEAAALQETYSVESTDALYR